MSLKKNLFRLCSAAGAIIVLSLPHAASGQPLDDRVVTILVTSQKHDYASPWQKGEIVRSRITGCVIEGNMILTAAYSMSDSVLIEVMKKGESRKYTASVAIRDYHCGLALLAVDDAAFFNGLKPASFSPAGSLTGRSAAVYRWDAMSSFKEYRAELTKTSIRFYEPNCGIIMHQFSTSMNDGGNGEPVFIDNMLVGVATGLNAEMKTLYVIGSDMVRRMIRDAADGKYDGIPFFWIDGVDIQGDKNLREYFGVAPDEGGVLITNVPSITSGSDVLKKDDIILAIDGHRIDDRGNYDSPYGKLYFYGLLQLNRYVGDEVSMTILRQKKSIDVRFRLKKVPEACCTILINTFDADPKYYIVGGLVFQELSLGYLESFGQDWKQQADKRLIFFSDNIKTLKDGGFTDRIVILSRVLPDPVNKGYQFLKDIVCTRVNGVAVTNLPELKKIIERSDDRYIVLEFKGETTIVLDRKTAMRAGQNILKSYNISAPHNIPDR